jgi:hypothetical protein
VLPFLVWSQHPLEEYEMALTGLGFGSSNLGFIAAAILLPLGWRRTALVCALLALASMLAGGYVVPAQQSELVGGPAGHLGPGYYAWVTAGALMLWTAFSSRSAR